MRRTIALVTVALFIVANIVEIFHVPYVTDFSVYLLLFPGLIVTALVYAVTGWNCSAALGGHGPSCELAVSFPLWLAACFTAFLYLGLRYRSSKQHEPAVKPPS